MRIISSDGFFDLPYELSNVNVHANRIFAVTRYSFDGMYTMGLYSSADRVENAMNELHIAYSNGRKVFRFPADIDDGCKNA